jgi:hypothetical protein
MWLPPSCSTNPPPAHPRPCPPCRWFDLVVVLQADNGVLYERLEKRGYPPHKVGGGGRTRRQAARGRFAARYRRQ